MENLSTKYELEIESLREEKTDILAQILEVERQIHLWERKIKLQNKMQEIIKPESGKKEIDDITYTIHRQEILYKKLKQEQEQVIKNMKMEIDRRDYIKLKFPNKTTNIVNNTKGEGNVNRELNNLQNDLNYIAKEKKKINKNLQEKKEEWQSMQGSVDNSRLYMDNLEEDLKKLENVKLNSIIQKNNLLYSYLVINPSA